MEGKALYENALELARCMREGAKLHPQAIGFYVINDGSGWLTCALGGATAIKTGMTHNMSLLQEAVEADDPYAMIATLFPCVSIHLHWHYTKRHYNVYKAIMYRNDHRRLSRERIADIIERWARMKLAELETT